MKDMRKITKKATKKVTNKPIVQPTTVETEEAVYEELDRACKPKHNHEQNSKKMYCECECECICNKKPDCEPCKIDAEKCIDNTSSCGPECCDPIEPQKFSPANSVPYAIEANRIYDTMRFQTFTDASADGGEPLSFEYEVVEVRGPIPRGGEVNVVIEKVCLNYSELKIKPGIVTLEDFEVEPLERVKPCDTIFDYAVCVERNNKCCNRGQGQRVVYKQKGVVVIAEDLVLELVGRCGCTEIVILAYPVTNSFGCKHRRCDDVEFIFNTLSSPICCPASGQNVTLRQDFQINLTVDCVGKAILKYDECHGHDHECHRHDQECCGHEDHYKVRIPNGIDLICCLQETVSILINEQIVVLGAPQVIQPRIVDTFSNVCDFTPCEDIVDEENKGCKNKKGHCGCC